MKKETITVKVYADYFKGTVEDHPVEASIVGGLAVHKDPKYGKSWTITHIASGVLAFSHIRTRALALQVAEELEAVLDWYKPSEALPIAANDPERAQILEIAQRYGLLKAKEEEEEEEE